MTSETWMRGGNLADRAPNAPRDRGTCPLRGTPDAARSAAEAQRTRQRFHNPIQLFASALRGAQIVPRIGRVNVALQFANARLNLPASTFVNHRIPTPLIRSVRQLQTVHFDAWLRKEARQITESFLTS